MVTPADLLPEVQAAKRAELKLPPTAPDPLREFTPTGDNSETLSAVIDYAAAQGDTVHFDGQFFDCLTKVVARGGRGLELEGPGGIRRSKISDTRVEPYLNLIEITDAHILGLQLAGADVPGTPGPTTTETREAQHGIWLQTCKRLDICGAEISDISGDFYYLDASTPNGAPNEDIRILGGKLRNNGRAAFGVSGCNRFLAQGVQINALARDLYHVESGDRAGDPFRGYQEDHSIVGCSLLSGGHNFAYVTGDSGLKRLRVQSNIRRGGWINVIVGDSGRLADGSARYQDVMVLDNLHDRPAAGGYFKLGRHVDGFTDQGNVGPLRPIYTIAQQLVMQDVRGARMGPNGYWRVVRGERVTT